MGSNFEISKSGLNNSFSGRQMITERIPFNSHANRSGKRLEDGFYFVMFIFAVAGDIQITTRRVRKRFKEMKEHFGGHITHSLTLKMCIPYDPVSPAEIQ